MYSSTFIVGTTASVYSLASDLRRSYLIKTEITKEAKPQIANTITPNRGAASANSKQIYESMKPTAYEAIIIKPIDTVSSIGYESSFANAIPIGIVGTRKMQPIIIITDIGIFFLVGITKIIDNSSKPVPKQNIRIIHKYYLNSLSNTPEIIDEATPIITHANPSKEI